MKRLLKLIGLTHEQLTPSACPVRTVPDYDALYQRMVDNGGWTVLKTDPTEDRRTVSGAMESPLVKAFNCWVRQSRKEALYTRRLALNAWYLQLGTTPTNEGQA